jgi:hypothetical protein
VVAKLPRPPRTGRWSSFVADPASAEVKARILYEDGNPRHRLRVEHDRYTLLIHLSDEDGDGWTCVAVDRRTRQARTAHARTQEQSSVAAYDALYEQ